MSSRFDVQARPMLGLNVLTRKPVGDNRGWFERMFCIDELHDLMGDRNVLQINHTMTHKKGSVRGMHFQHAPSAEMKFVSCLRGEVFDVAVDLRLDSATFLQWHAELLTFENRKTLAIPEGFAHGFQTLTDNCEMFYLHTAAYDPAAEGGVNPKDPLLAIRWPLPIAELSVRDGGFSMITKEFPGASL